jgi:hypothetical protein
MKKQTKQFWENLVMLFIFLVLVQTFLTDLAEVALWSWNIRKIMIITAFLFDLIFTLEFLIRFFYALYQGPGELKKYFFMRQGWVDLIVSIPLLLFSSTPELFALVTGSVIGGFGGVLNILKVVKSVRIARLLRILRVLKIFKHIKYADSTMAQRHTGRIVTTVVTSIIFSLTIMSFTASFLYLNDLNADFEQSQKDDILYLLGNRDLLENRENLSEYCTNLTDFLIVKKGDSDLYSRYNQDYYEKNYGFNDYGHIQSDDYQFFYDLKKVNVSNAWNSLVIFIEIVLVIIILMITYSTHFAINVTDPINIMMKGLNDDNYNLEVTIPENYQDDDIFRLAKSFNDEYLPLKARNAEEDQDDKLELDLGDLDDLLKF